MSVPGLNLLNMASGLIHFQTAQLRRFTGRVTNAQGLDDSTYAAPVPFKGSIQPIPKARYEALGLDWNKIYVMIFSSEPLQVIKRDGTGDRVIYAGLEYLCEDEVDWKAQDGWAYTTAVQVPPVP